MAFTRRSLLRGLGAATAAGTGLSLGAATLSARGSSQEVTALVAGSLLELADGVPGASVEAHGSVAVRRLVLDGLREPDVVAVAEPSLLAGIAERATLFATNALVIAYHPDSTYAGRLEADWREAISAHDIELGRTDPRKDPLGYRTVMALRLAERREGVDADAVLEAASVFLETDLLNALEGGKLDAAFTYRNMAVQRGFPYVSLPPKLDFSDPAYEATYASVTYDYGDGTTRGTPIRYAAAALTEAGNTWLEGLVTGRDRLLDAGFSVPSNYPLREQQIEGGD